MLELLVRVALVVLVLGGGFVAWRNAQARGLTARGGPVLRVVGRAGLTRSSLVAIVDVDGRRFLVGAAEQGVQLLASLGESESASEAPPVMTDTDAGTHGDPDAVGGHASVPGDIDRDPARAAPAPRPTTLAAAFGAALGAHGRGTSTRPDGPRIGPLDRLRDMTVRSHVREPIRVHSSDLD